MGARRAEEVRELLAWADVLIHPSLTEAFGVAVAEAQAMGLPVVCSDAGGLPENVAHEVTGFVVGRRDAIAMADRLVELASDPALRRRMGRAARRRAETVLSADHQLDRFEQLYSALLADRADEPGEPLDDARGAVRRERAQHLRAEIDELEARKEALRVELWRQQVSEEVQAFVARAVPPGAHVLVVSRGDEEIVDLPGHRGAHFPQAIDGAYAGHHPADSADAIAQLEALRAGGAEFLIVPATAGWWFEHYDEFARHLDAEYTRVEGSGEHFAAFALKARAHTSRDDSGHASRVIAA
jgi:hypothetical protein